MKRLYSSPGSTVTRRRRDGRHVVVKTLVGENADDRFAREVGGLTLAAAATPPLVPELIDADPERHRLVMAHLDVEDAPIDWIAYAEALAHLHGVPADLPPARVTGAAELAAFLTLADALGATTTGARAELEALLTRLDDQRGTSLVHGDPCRGNALTVGGRIWFVDFEQCGSGDGLAELAYLRAGFPSCGHADVLDDATITAAEAAYEAIRPIDRDRLTDHCVAWMLRPDMLAQRIERGRFDPFERILAEDWRWGLATARERMARRLGICHDLAARRPDLAATAELTARMRNRMAATWPALA